MSKQFKLFCLALCCGALTVACFEWTQALAWTSPAASSDLPQVSDGRQPWLTT